MEVQSDNDDDDEALEHDGASSSEEEEVGRRRRRRQRRTHSDRGSERTSSRRNTKASTNYRESSSSHDDDSENDDDDVEESSETVVAAAALSIVQKNSKKRAGRKRKASPNTGAKKRNVEPTVEAEPKEYAPFKISKILACRSETTPTWKTICCTMNTTVLDRGSRWTPTQSQQPQDTTPTITGSNGNSTAEAAATEERFLIKWSDVSYMHCSWETAADLVESIEGAQSALARFGTKSQGQGHETTYAQIIAEEGSVGEGGSGCRRIALLDALALVQQRPHAVGTAVVRDVGRGGDTRYLL